MLPITLFDALVIAVLLGWPGLFVGVVVGVWRPRTHRWLHAAWLGLGGLVLSIIVRLLWPW